MPAKSNAARLKLMMKNRKAKGIHEWKAKEAAKGAHASRIQSFFRGALQRRRLALWKEASAVVQAQVRGLVERKADRRRRTGVKRLQRVFRGAKVRQRLMKMAQALVLIQRTLRGYVTRMRLQRRKMRKKRVVHSAAAIRRLLASAVKLHEVMDSNSGDYPITWTQYRDTNTDKVFYLRTEHLKYADQTDTRWEAPECFRGRFVCGFDDLGEDGVCEERFDSEFEVETHRKQVHQWDCDACFWHNHWREWPKCAMCGNEYTEAGRSIDDLIKERVFEREQIAALAKLKESVRQKQREKKIAREAKIRRQQEAVVMRREKQSMSAEDIASACLRDADAKLPQQVNEDTPGDAVARHLEAQTQATAQGQTKLALQPNTFTFTAHFELQAMKAGPSAFSQLTSVLEEDPRLAHALPIRGDNNKSYTLSELPNGAKYVGELAGGVPHGEGECHFKNGGIYRGHWHRGYRSGFGEHKSPDGDLYVGAWKDGSRHGFGKLCLADGGHVFEGTWGHGNMVGIGTWTCQETGNSYKGKWERGVFEGSGQYVDKAAGVYRGQFHDGERHGKGIMTYYDGSVYRGEWADGFRVGRGFFCDRYGHKWIGTWFRGRLHGNGVFIENTGPPPQPKYPTSETQAITAETQKGPLAGSATEQLPALQEVNEEQDVEKRATPGIVDRGPLATRSNSEFAIVSADKQRIGERYEGEFSNSIRSGKGKACFSNGDEYTGQWRADLPHGHGTYIWRLRRERYTGKFKDGRRHGRGVQYFRNGDVYDGMWSDDVIQGRGIMMFQNGDKFVPRCSSSARPKWSNRLWMYICCLPSNN
eukprot:INCI610.2.p1 GENE.INCI610.2~~INCI610.2.p1  ORF type:complete len:816 (-),score=129.62 INCI610.2:465-2912(-)